MGYEELKDKIRSLKSNYSGRSFREVVESIKREKINDDAMLQDIEEISLKRFGERTRLTLGVLPGNLLEAIATIAILIMLIRMDSEWMLYISVPALMTTLHPLSHYIMGTFLGIRFTHYYLNGPAKIEPTMRIDNFSYLKTPGKKRALMHLSGVIGTICAPLVAAFFAIWNGSEAAVTNLLVIFVLLIIFELLTSTKTGDLKKVKREYEYR